MPNIDAPLNATNFDLDYYNCCLEIPISKFVKILMLIISYIIILLTVAIFFFYCSSCLFLPYYHFKSFYV